MKHFFILLLLFWDNVEFTLTNDGVPLAQGILPQGPIDAPVGGTAIFRTLLQNPDFGVIIWNFKNGEKLVPISTLTPELLNVNEKYRDRANIDANGTLTLSGLTEGDSGQYSITVLYKSFKSKTAKTQLRVTGPQCKTEAKGDFVLVLDGSWSIGETNFQTVKNVIGRLVSAFDIGPDHVQIGLVQYSSEPKTEWHLNSHQTKASLQQAVDNLPYRGGETVIEEGTPPGPKKDVVVLLDGAAAAPEEIPPAPPGPKKDMVVLLDGAAAAPTPPGRAKRDVVDLMDETTAVHEVTPAPPEPNRDVVFLLNGPTPAPNPALNYILENFHPNAGLRNDAKKIGIVITDGKSQGDFVLASQSLRDSGIELYAIGVKQADETELRSVASDPDELHAFNVNDFQNLSDIVANLTENLCNSIKGPAE